MRIRRSDNGRRVMIGLVGIALSMVGGVVVGHTAIGSLDPAYARGSTGSTTERPWRSLKASRGPADADRVPTIYGNVAPVSVIDPAIAATPNPVPDAEPSAWERRLDAEYARWQSDMDRTLRTPPDDDPAPRRLRDQPDRGEHGVDLTTTADRVPDASEPYPPSRPTASNASSLDAVAGEPDGAPAIEQTS